MLVGVSEDELGDLCAGVGRGCRNDPEAQLGHGSTLVLSVKGATSHYFG